MYNAFFSNRIDEIQNSLDSLSGEFSNLSEVRIFIPSIWRFSQFPPRVEVVNEIINYFKSKSINVIVSYDGLKMNDWIKRIDTVGVELQDFTKTRYLKTDGIGELNVHKYGKQDNLRIPILQNLYINSEISESKAIIPIFCPYPSNVFHLNGCMSSFMSVIPTETRSRILLEAKSGKHHEALVELFSLVYKKILFSVYDFSNLFSWSGNGETEPRKNNSILVTTDSVAGDSMVSTIIKWPKLSIKSIRIASSLGFGDGMLDNDLWHENKPEIAKIDHLVSDKNHIFFPVSMITRFKIRVQDNCNGCGECIYACPNGSIIMGNGKPKVSHSMCVKCFACVDSCPEFALWINRSP